MFDFREKKEEFLPVVLKYSNSTHRGPGKVVQNLEEGFKIADIPCGNKYESDPRALTGFLQTMPEEMFGGGSSDPRSNALVGPNLFVLPTEWTDEQLKKFKHYVVPSEWVRNLYKSFHQLDHATIDVWSVGIDTKKFDCPWRETRRVTEIRDEDRRCLVYYKNRSKTELEIVQRMLNKYKIAFKVLEYGEYQESEFIDLCQWANFGILLTGTESQGIAYMEMLSTDLPLFVFDKPTWMSDDKHIEVTATSVPYFDPRCGVVTKSVNLELFETFLGKVQKYRYRPRTYILEEHRLKTAAQKYYELCTKYQLHSDEPTK